MLVQKTELIIDKNPDKITKSSRVLGVGSRFSTLLFRQMAEAPFYARNNPYGNLYNPLSVFHALQSSLENKPVNTDMLVEYMGKWHHYDFHVDVQADSRSALLRRLEEIHDETQKEVQKTDFLWLTFGSAFVFKLNSSKHIVANCHKTPGRHFVKRLLAPEEIVAGFRHVYPALHHIKNIVLMVSPIFQLNDSLTLNSVSKSVLRYACHSIMSEFPFVKYFPAYELMHSDLRDYHFYEDDLVTPTTESMQYIFEKMKTAYME